MKENSSIINVSPEGQRETTARILSSGRRNRAKKKKKQKQLLDMKTKESNTEADDNKLARMNEREKEKQGMSDRAGENWKKISI